MTTHTPGPAPSAEEAEAIASAAARIHGELGRAVGIGTIQQLMADSLDRLAHAQVRADGPDRVQMAEQFTRDRLRAVARSEGAISDGAPSVLFLCVHNAGRSQMAAGWMRHLAGDRVDVLSGGSAPAGQINPAAVEAMREVGVDITSQFPRPWTDEIVGAVDVVVTMGCGDACPVVPGTRYVDWELDDPAGQPVDAVRPVRDEIERRVRGLLDELDVDVAG